MTGPNGTADVVFTVDEAAQLLRISRGLAFSAIHSGTIPSLRIGRRILIPRAALLALIDGDDGPDRVRRAGL